MATSEIKEIRQRKLAEVTARFASDQLGSGHSDAPVELTDSDFEEFVIRNNHVVVDCRVPWCRVRRMPSPIIDSLARDMKGEVSFGKLNTDENFETASRYRITSIPRYCTSGTARWSTKPSARCRAKRSRNNSSSSNRYEARLPLTSPFSKNYSGSPRRLRAKP